MNIITALDEFIADCVAAGRSQHTIKAYRSHITAFAAHCPKLQVEVSRQDVRDYMTGLRSRSAYLEINPMQGMKQPRQPLSGRGSCPLFQLVAIAGSRTAKTS